MKKLIYVVSLFAENSVVKSTFTSLDIDHPLAESHGVDSKDCIEKILSEDKTVDKEFVTQFTNAISETSKPVLIMRNYGNKQLVAILSEGITIGYDMPKYLKKKSIYFANKAQSIADAARLRFNDYTEVITIRPVA